MSGFPTIDAAWRSYAEQVIPPNASSVQRRECRRAFYAGAAGALCAATSSDKTLLDALDELNAELAEFNDRVLKGKA